MATPHQLNTSFNDCLCIQICAIYETSIFKNNSLLFILNESVMKFVFVGDKIGISIWFIV